MAKNSANATLQGYIRGVLIGLLGFFMGNLNSQDIHFSQFYMSPLNLNPAMTGVMNGNIRLTGNYRNQWASVLRDKSFRTYSVSYDQRFAVGRNDFFGVGGTVWGDKTGDAGFATQTGKMSFSYSKKIAGYRDKASYVVVGGEAGVAQRSIDFLNLRWGTQHNGSGGFDPTLSSNEPGFIFTNFIFADLAAGLLLFNVVNKNTNYYLGGAYHHLNRPNQSFSGSNISGVNVRNTDLIFTRITVHAGGEFPIAPNLGALPGIIYMKQGPAFQINGGNSFRFTLNDNPGEYQAFQVGAWARIASRENAITAGTPDASSGGVLMDAAILSARFDFNDISLGFSYDVNVSPLRAASNGQGAFEFSLQYKILGNTKKTVYCPDF
jgi:type IX secretion system PorP/SprF family membrane protein